MILKPRIDLITEISPDLGNPGVVIIDALSKKQRILCACIAFSLLENRWSLVERFKGENRRIKHEAWMNIPYRDQHQTEVGRLKLNPTILAWLSSFDDFNPPYTIEQIDAIEAIDVVSSLFYRANEGDNRYDPAVSMEAMANEIDAWLYQWQDTQNRQNLQHMIATFYGVPISTINNNADGIFTDWSATRPRWKHPSKHTDDDF